MATVVLQIPDELQTTLNRSGKDLGESLRLSAAYSLCQRGELSTSQAAKLAGLTYADFLESAAQAQVELFPVDFDELQEAIERGQSLGRERIANHSAGEGRVS